MFNLSIPDFLLTMATGVFLLGLISLCIGIFILVSRTMGTDIRTIATQTAKMAQKGITDEVAGLVGNASSLLSALDGLIKTSAGIGVFLVLVGLLMMGGSYWLVLQIPNML